MYILLPDMRKHGVTVNSYTQKMETQTTNELTFTARLSFFIRLTSPSSSSSTQRLTHSIRKAGTDSHGGSLHKGIFGFTLISNSWNLCFSHSKNSELHTSWWRHCWTPVSSSYTHCKRRHFKQRIPSVTVVTFTTTHKTKAYCLWWTATTPQILV